MTANLRDQTYDSVFRSTMTRVLFSIQNRDNTTIVTRLSEALRSQWYGKDQLSEYRDNKLRRLLQHAASTVPRYRDLRSSIDGSQAQRILARFPIVNKESIRCDPEGFRSAAARGSRWGSTGGSTGKPLKFLMDSESLAWGQAAWWRGRIWHGVRIGDRAAVIGARRVSLPGFVRQRLASTFPLEAFGDTDVLLKNLHVLERVRPITLNSFASVLLRHANLVLSSGRDIRIPFVFSTGESLHAQHRDTVQRAFQARVLDCYGSNEVSGIAYQCEDGQSHITDEHVFIEVVDSQGHSVQNQVGRILLTDLDNYQMPFIRYDIGDIGSLSTSVCSCGRGLTVLSHLGGRRQDYLLDHSGDAIPASVFVNRFSALKHIDGFQILQPSSTSFRLLFVAEGEDPTQELRHMVEFIAECVGGSPTIITERVPSIPLTPHGKTRYVISEAFHHWNKTSRTRNEH